MKRQAALVSFAGLALAVAAFGAAAQSTHAQIGPSPFVAPPAPSVSTLPACGAGLDASAGPRRSDGNAVALTVALSLPTGGPCVIAGFPAVTFAGHSPSDPLPVGRLSTASSVSLDPQTLASFNLRYVVAPNKAAPGCALAFAIAGTHVGGAPLTITPCRALSEIDVSSFSPLVTGIATSPAPLPTLPRRVRSCDAADLGVRDVAATSGEEATARRGEATTAAGDLSPSAAAQQVTVAVQNRSLTPCAVPQRMRVALLGARGRLVNAAATFFGSSTVARNDVALAAGHEASLTVDFATRDARPATGDAKADACPKVGALALVFPDGRFTASAPTQLTFCADTQGITLRQTTLQQGVPLPDLDPRF